MKKAMSIGPQGGSAAAAKRDLFHQLSTPTLLINGEDMEDCNFGIDDDLGDTQINDSEPHLTKDMATLNCNDLQALEYRTGKEPMMDTESFDKTIGAVEDIVVGEEFQSLQNFYLSKYWMEFDANDVEGSLNKGDASATGNRHEHFQIFQNYSREMAHLLETHLKKKIPEFNMSQFLGEISRRMKHSTNQGDGQPDPDHRDIFEGEIFEMLFTLTDFLKFKELFLDYRAMMEGKTPNLSTGISLKPLPSSSRLSDDTDE